MNLLTRAVNKYQRIQKNRTEARVIKRQLRELEQKKVRYLDTISRTRERLERLYEQCDSVLVDDSEFLKSGTVEFCRKIAREQVEDEMYLPCIAYIYFACRILMPKVVIETGVERGSSTYTILTALRKNGSGNLHSFDLTPHIHADWGLGIAPVIPRPFYEGTAGNFTHHHGRTSDTLQPGIKDINQVDLFIAGSDHGYENQNFEVRTVWSKMPSGGICIVDRPDYEGNNYRAWEGFLTDFKPSWTVMLPEGKESLTSKFGVMIKT